MYLQDHVGDPQAVIAEAVASAPVRKSPDIETAMREVAKAVEKTFKLKCAQRLEAELEDLVVGFQLVEGEWSADMDMTVGAQAKADYESALDDIVETFTEPYVDALTANWLGINTIDSQVWVEGGVQRFALSMAKELYKGLAGDKTPAQSLANAGITREAVEAALENFKQGKAEPVTGDNDLNSTIAKAKAYLGADFDLMTVYEDLETIVGEDDEILVNSAAARLGLGEDDVGALQIEALNVEEDAAQHLLDLIQSADKPRRQRQDKAERKATAADMLDPAILNALKNCGAQDTQFAEKLGVSRSTYTNYLKGKSEFRPDANQYATIREELVARANEMLEALANLDGTEAMEVA